VKTLGAAVALMAGLISVFSPSAPAQAARGRVRLDESAKFSRPWIEGLDPVLENQVFDAAYRVLPKHNILKIYMHGGDSYESGGIRFSARIPHQRRDLSLPQMDAEAAALIRTTFDQFPQVQALDVWATIPVAQARQAAVENTVFSVSADRAAYLVIRRRHGLDAVEFVDSFGRVWAAPGLSH